MFIDQDYFVYDAAEDDYSYLYKPYEIAYALLPVIDYYGNPIEYYNRNETRVDPYVHVYYPEWDYGYDLIIEDDYFIENATRNGSYV